VLGGGDVGVARYLVTWRCCASARSSAHSRAVASRYAPSRAQRPNDTEVEFFSVGRARLEAPKTVAVRRL
jgi:hypothetical protein